MTANISPSPLRAKRRRAPASGNRLSKVDAALVKAILSRYPGYDQHYIGVTFFGVNGGRISEVKTGKKFVDVLAASDAELDAFLASRRPLH